MQLDSIVQPLVLQDGDVRAKLLKIADDAKRAGAALDKDLAGGAKEAGTSLQQTGQQVTGFSTSLGSLAKAAGVFGLVAGGLQQVTQAVRDLVQTSGQLAQLSAQVDVGVRDLQRFGEAAKLGGGDLTSVGAAFDTMTKQIVGGSKQTAEVLDRLGLSFRDLQGLNTRETFEQLAEAIRRTENPMVRADAAMRLFGSAGMDLLPAMVEGIIEVGDEAEALGKILSERTIANLDRTAKAWDTLKTSVQAGFGNAVGDILTITDAIGKALPNLGAFVGYLTQLNAFAVHNRVAKWSADKISALNWSAHMDADAARLAAGTGGGLPAAAVPDVSFSFGDKSVAAIERESAKQLAALNRHYVALDRAAKAHAKALAADARAAAQATASFLGVGLIESASKAVAAFETAKAAGISLSKDALQRINADLRAGNEAAQRLVGFIPAGWREIQEATESVIETTQQYRKLVGSLLPKAIQDGSRFIRFELLDVGTQVTLLRGQMMQLFASLSVMNPALMTMAGEVGSSFAVIGDEVASATAAIRSGLMAAISDIPRTLQQAFTGGGGVIGALKALGVQVADAVMRPLMEQLKALGPRVQGAVGGGIAGAGIIGGATGGAAGAIIGTSAATISGVALSTTALGIAAKTSWVAMAGLSAATLGIGAAAAGVYLLASRFFSVSKEVKQARVDIEQFQQALHQTMTAQQRIEAAGNSWAATMITVRDAYIRMGRSAAEAEAIVGRLINDRNPEAARAAMAEINRVVGEFQELLRSANTRFGELMTSAAELGTRLPDTLLVAIERLREMGDLTEENIALFTQLTNQAEVDWTKMQEAAERYGIDVQSLGGQFQSLRLNDAAKQIINDFDLLVRGGADVGAILFGMQEEISALVQESLRFGTSIPENMRPWIDELLRVGLLVDDSGKALEDLAGLKFGDPIVTAFQEITDALWELIRTLQGPFDAAIRQPRTMDIDVNVHERRRAGAPDDPGYASGTIGRIGSWWKDFGAGTPTTLHNVEAVLRPQDVGPFVAAHSDPGGLAGGRGGADVMPAHIQIGSDVFWDTVLRKVGEKWMGVVYP